MIDAVRQALTHIYSVIPNPILEAAFKPYEANVSFSGLFRPLWRPGSLWWQPAEARGGARPDGHSG